MRPFERRENQAYPYYKLATWDPRSFTWRDGKQAYATPEAARLGLSKGRYRLSEITAGGRNDLQPFEV